MKKKLVVFGTATTGELAHYFFSNDSDYEVCAFCASNEYVKSESFLGLPLVPFDSVSTLFSPKNYEFFVAVGFVELNDLRKRIYYEAKRIGYTMASYISSATKIAGNCKIGEHFFTMQDISIEPFSVIGNNVILASYISHHSIINDHCFISGRVAMGGCVEIGECTFIGMGVTIQDHLRIGERCLIGENTLIKTDVEAESVFAVTASKKLNFSSERFVKIFPTLRSGIKTSP
jgi:sugar O-acyltransferase (sialic acid O-acetyltransferase NeuD family)